MRIFVVLILAAAFIGSWFIWSRDPLADVPTSAHGFIDVPLPHGTDANTVLILTPPHSKRPTPCKKPCRRRAFPPHATRATTAPIQS